MGWSFPIGSISGIRIRVHLTFVILLVWFGLAFWHEGGPQEAINGLAYILLLFACVVLHEFGHILTARRFGAQTLDVVLLPIGGVARMKSIPEKPAQELAVALAGPCVNLVIAFVLISLIGPQSVIGGFAPPARNVPLLTQIAVANLILAVFNLVPAFPMDGGRALRALLSCWLGRAAATRLAARIGQALAVGFGAYGFLSGQPLLMLIAVFVYLGASAENQSTQMQQLARNLTLADTMITQFSTLPVTACITDAVAVLIHSTQHDVPIIDGVGKLIGLLTRNQILRAIHDQRPDAVVADLMRNDIPTLPSQAKFDDALKLMSDGLPLVAVGDASGRMVGMVTRESLAQMMLLETLRSGH